MASSVSQTRRLYPYPCNKYFCLFKAQFHGQSDTKGFEAMAKEFFSKMSEKEIQRLQEFYRTNIAKKKK